MKIYLGENYINNFFDLITEFNLGKKFLIITDQNIISILPNYISNYKDLIILKKP